MTASSAKVGIWLTLVVGLWGYAAADPHGWRQYLKTKAEVRTLDEQNRLASRENRRLSREARALKQNPAAIERAVREELGFIHPGEMVLELREDGE